MMLQKLLPKRKTIAGLVTAGVTAVLSLVLIDDAITARLLAIGSVCLALWLFEIVPAFVPTILLVAALPLFLGSQSRAFSLTSTLGAAADPVMALFFGGFVLAGAARRHGLDTLAASAVLRASRGKRRVLVVLLACTSAFLSMWMSNIAAAAMLLQVVRPLIDAEPRDSHFRRALLLAIAFGANFGGMATPIGSGPNAIAIASSTSEIAFARWMAFALPLTVLLLAAACAIILLAFRLDGAFVAPPLDPAKDAKDAKDANDAKDAPRKRVAAVSLLFACCVIAWLTEPLHGVPAAVIAVVAAATLFLTALVDERELKELDWSTLLLIAGGIILGRALEAGGLLTRAAELASTASVDPRATIAIFVVGAALLSSLMSNTATATLLIPLALTAVPGPTTAVLIAIACSLGAPFAISTPPNAMAFGAGARARDLFIVGAPLMVLGCLAIIATGPRVLSLFGLH